MKWNDEYDANGKPLQMAQSRTSACVCSCLICMIGFDATEMEKVGLKTFYKYIFIEMEQEYWGVIEWHDEKHLIMGGRIVMQHPLPIPVNGG